MESHQGQTANSRPPDQRDLKPPTFNTWTDAELVVFKQWQSDSFWYRSVPLSATFVFVTESLIKHGRLKGIARLPRYARLPISVLCGFTLGRTSALGDLHKRMKEQCPDGAVATFLRQAEERRAELTRPSSEFDSSQSQPAQPYQGSSVGTPNQGYQGGGETDALGRLQDRNRGGNFTEQNQRGQDAQPEGKHLTYYEKLREQKRTSRPQDSPTNALPEPTRGNSEPTFFADKPISARPKGKKTKYGDDWDES